jgi:hypothetical protein
MKENNCRGSLLIWVAIFISILTSLLPLGTSPLIQEVTASDQVIWISEWTENKTISPLTYESIDIDFVGRQNLEVVFTLQVIQDIPIDVWFMDEDNYTLFSNGDQQFSFHIDGSEQQVTYTKNIVILEEQGLYKLVMDNFNNQTIKVNVVYEFRTYFAMSKKTSSEDNSAYVLPLLILVIILAALLIVFAFKFRKYKQVKSDEPETLEEKQGESEVANNISPGFCGYCGKSIDTPYCKYCGREN